MPTPPDVRFPSIDGLRAFDAAARLGTFERAADELAITASAVSKRVAAVEELLGTALFSRTGKALALTAAGKEYLSQVRGALGLLAAMPQHQRTTQRRRRLRVATPPTFARQVLVPRLEGFTAAHPDVELEVVLSIPFLDTQPADADVVVRFAAPGSDPACDVLMHDRVLPLAAPSLLSRLAPVRQPADLLAAPLLRTPLEPWLPWFQAAGLTAPEPMSGPKLVDLGLTLEAAVSGQGIALGRPSLARHWLSAGSLVPVLSIGATPACQYGLIVQARQPAALAFAGWLKALCDDVTAQAQEALSRHA